MLKSIKGKSPIKFFRNSNASSSVVSVITNASDTVEITESNLLVKQFNDLNITVYGTYQEPLFKAKDIGDLLGLKILNQP